MRSSGSVGLGLAVLSAATFGTSGSFASALLASGWTPGAAVAVRVSLAALMLTVPAVLQLRGRWSQLRRSLSTVLAFGVFAVGGAQLFYFNAVDHLSVAVALLLEYSGTLLVVGWVWLRYGNRPRRLTLAGAGIALTGLVLVLDLTGSQHIDIVGVLWGLAAATGLACYFIISSRTEDPLPPLALSWAGLVVGAVILLVLGALGAVPMRANTHDADFNGHHVNWLIPVFGLSFIAAAVAYAAGIGAARRLGARLASFVGLAEVLFAVGFAWLLLGQQPTLLQGIGGLVVLAGIALVRLDEREPIAPVSPPHEPELPTTLDASDWSPALVRGTSTPS